MNSKASQHLSPVQKGRNQYASQYVSPVASQSIFTSNLPKAEVHKSRLQDHYTDPVIHKPNFDPMAPFKFIYDEIPLPKPVTNTQVRITTLLDHKLSSQQSQNQKVPPSSSQTNQQTKITQNVKPSVSLEQAKSPSRPARQNLIHQIIKRTDDKPNILNLKACSVFDNGVVYEDMDLKISFESKVSEIQDSGNSRGIFELSIKAKARFKLRSVLDCLHEGKLEDFSNCQGFLQMIPTGCKR